MYICLHKHRSRNENNYYKIMYLTVYVPMYVVYNYNFARSTICKENKITTTSTCHIYDLQTSTLEYSVVLSMYTVLHLHNLANNISKSALYYKDY